MAPTNRAASRGAFLKDPLYALEALLHKLDQSYPQACRMRPLTAMQGPHRRMLT